MKNILYVDCCMRPNSRTEKLAQQVLSSLEGNISTLKLTEEGLTLPDWQLIQQRNKAVGEGDMTNPLLRYAVQFAQADEIIIAAPYWDLSFPSILKIWVENMYVRNLTFYYENDRPVGLCRGRESIYITTAGSPIGENDWGAMYMKAVLTTLGIPGFSSIRAEALDLDTTDADAVMEEACRRAARAAQAFVQRMQTK